MTIDDLIAKGWKQTELARCTYGTVRRLELADPVASIRLTCLGDGDSTVTYALFECGRLTFNVSANTASGAVANLTDALDATEREISAIRRRL